MNRTMRRLAVLTLLACPLAGAATARAQYYPPGYGGYGWRGWGAGTTVAGSRGAGAGMTAAGMGVYAAGAGQYNVETAQARQMNVQTAEQYNDYMWQTSHQHAQQYYQELVEGAEEGKRDYNAVQDRILNNPTDIDLANGDTLNAVLLEITAPKVYPQTLQKATQAVPGPMVKNIPFRYASAAICYSLGQLTTREEVPKVFSNAVFTEQRKQLRAIATQLLNETKGGQSPNPETIKQFRAGLDRARKTLASIEPGADARLEGENYLKALYGVSRMLETPAYDVFLAGVEKVPSVPLSDVLSFMHAFNLQFGPAKTPEQRESYSQLYGLLSNLRPAGGLPPQATQAPPGADQRPDSRVVNFFSGMDYSHFNPPSGPPPAPPVPGSR
jgi:hypothetical protein